VGSVLDVRLDHAGGPGGPLGWWGCRIGACRRLVGLVGLAVVAGGFGPFRREVVVESGASIDGSLLYGDLPALDGAETTDIADALVLAFERRPQHPKRPGSRVGVKCAHLGFGGVARALSERRSWCVDRATLMPRTRMG